MSRRRERSAQARGGDDAADPPARARAWSVGAQIGVLVAVFVIATALAELAGAANLGVAVGSGQIAFALTLVVLLLRSP